MPNDVIAIIFGGSHVYCIARAAHNYQPHDPRFSVHIAAAGSRALPGGATLIAFGQEILPNPIILDALERVRKANPQARIWLVEAYRNSEASWITMLQDEHPFGLAVGKDGQEIALGEGRLMSETLFKKLLRHRLADLDDLLDALSRVAVAGIIHLPSPPPLRDEKDVIELLHPSTIEKAKSSGMIGEEVIANSTDLRQRAWELECEIGKEICDERGVFFLQPDNALIGEDGLRDKDSAADAFHGNEAWGLAIIEQLERTILQFEDEKTLAAGN